MTIDGKIRGENLQYINREAAKISALSSSKIDKYEYLTGVEVLPSKANWENKLNVFVYSSLRKAFKSQLKTTGKTNKAPRVFKLFW